MRPLKEHLILTKTTIRSSLSKLNKIAPDATCFVVDNEFKLLGCITDGDIRRGLIKGIGLEEPIDKIIQKKPKYLIEHEYKLEELVKYRNENFKVLPLVNKKGKIVSIINFRLQYSYLPIDVVIMAGGKGTRLKPLTNSVPKPLLNVGDKPILEYNIDRLYKYGLENIWISVNYLGEQIEEYFGDGKNQNVRIKYQWEDKPLGTIGAVSNIEKFTHSTVLVTNSDILTNLNYEDFYQNFLNTKADMAVVTIAFKVDIPYAVMEIDNGNINSFREKPTYTYYSNGGIYLIKSELLNIIPKNSFFNTTDLIEELIAKGKKVISYPFAGYWLDIGKHDDFEKAQVDIKKIVF